jgi:hypothetical protein
MAGRGRAAVRFITINKSSSAPFSGRVDSISVMAFHEPQHNKRELFSQHSQTTVFNITAATADVARDGIHDTRPVGTQRSNNQKML